MDKMTWNSRTGQFDQRILDGFIEETLRYWSPVQGLVRMATRDTEVCGAVIPAGSVVSMRYGAANRDPAVFEDPDRFDPERRTRDKLTFGQGSHSCPGLHMARANIRIAAQAILDRYLDFDALYDIAGRAGSN